jgi:hypothetical protein
MTASENPAPPPSTAAAGPAEQRDDLEHWLSDLRTEVAENPSDWIDTEPGGEAPAAHPPVAAPVVSRPASVGRHRSPD